MNVTIAILIWLSIGYITARCAEKRGRNLIAWFVLGILFGLFALIAVFLLPPLTDESPLISVVKDGDEPKEPFLDLHDDWFYLDRENRQKGPVSFEDLAVAWDDGIITVDSYVWCESMEEWKKIKDVPDLLENLKKY